MLGNLVPDPSRTLEFFALGLISRARHIQNGCTSTISRFHSWPVLLCRLSFVLTVGVPHRHLEVSLWDQINLRIMLYHCCSISDTCPSLLHWIWIWKIPTGRLAAKSTHQNQTLICIWTTRIQISCLHHRYDLCWFFYFVADNFVKSLTQGITW